MPSDPFEDVQEVIEDPTSHVGLAADFPRDSIHSDMITSGHRRDNDLFLFPHESVESLATSDMTPVTIPSTVL